MSLYNMVNGANPATFFVLPMLGKHAEEYPRFRDCFLQKRQFELQSGLPVMAPIDDTETKPTKIVVVTRTGVEEDHMADIIELRAHPHYVEDFVDGFDSTFRSFVFNVPEEWQVDYDAIIETGTLVGVSDAYKKRLVEVYPKLEEKFNTFW